MYLKSMKNVLATALFLFSISGFAQSMQPGLWEAQSSFKLNGIPLPSSNDQECISAVDAKDAKATITKELKKQGCEILQWKVTGKNLDASLKCTNNDLDATGSLKGTFTNKSYNLGGEAKGIYQKVVPSQATLHLEGRWLKKCQ